MHMLPRLFVWWLILVKLDAANIKNDHVFIIRKRSSNPSLEPILYPHIYKYGVKTATFG